MRKLPLLLSLSILPALAQSRFGGEIDANGGLGNAAPLSSDVALNYDNGTFYLRPRVGYSLATRQNEGITQDQNLIYSATGDTLTHHSLLRTKGQTLRTSVDAGVRFSPEASIELRLSGLNSDIQYLGQRSEQLISAEGKAKSDIQTVLDDPTNQHSLLEGTATFRYQSRQPLGQSFSLTYGLTHDKSERERDIYGIDNCVFVPYISNVYVSDALTVTHRLTADYHQPLNEHHIIGGGLRGEMRSITANDLQVLDKSKAYDDSFEHDMKVAAAWVDYALRLAPFTVNAKVEYAFTRMGERDLHDVIPSLRAVYAITPAQNLTLLYGMRLVRPDVTLLNPARIRDTHSLSFGNADLTGMHAHQAALTHTLRTATTQLQTTVAHIWADDGFNAIWMVRDGIRIYTWGNEGIRRAWSLKPDFTWQLTPITRFNATAQLMWDKRVAEAISMEKEHIGIDASARVEQQFHPLVQLDVFGSYAEGNTIDLYSHQSRRYTVGMDAKVYLSAQRRSYLYLNAQLADYGHNVITQGAYTGSESLCPEHDYLVKAGFHCKF